jgi:hypothetical protein
MPGVRPRWGDPVDTREMGGEVTGDGEFDRGVLRQDEPPRARTGEDKITGIVRFDITDGGQTDHWLVGIDKGDIQVLHRNGQADCVIGGDRALLDGIVSGRVNPVAAMVRGALSSSRSLSTPTATRPTPCHPTSATCCGVASSTMPRPRPSWPT